MRTTVRNQHGFGAVETLLVIIAITLVVGVGYYVFNSNKTSRATAPVAAQTTALTSKSTATPTTPMHTAQDATVFAQKTYDDFVTALNNASTTNSQQNPGLVGLAAVKDSLSSNFYTKAAASQSGGDFSCAYQFGPSGYKASLNSSDSTDAIIGLVLFNSADHTSSTTGMTATVDLSSLKIVAVSCPR